MKKKVVILLQSLQQGGLSVSLLEALNIVDLTQYDITIYVYSNNNPWQDFFPKEINIIVDTDKTHYHRRPKAIWYHICILFFKFINNHRLKTVFEKKLHTFVHKKKAKYPARRYFKPGVDVVISYALGLCTEMAVEINANRKYLFFHSSKPDFHRDICEKCFYYFDNIIAVGTNVQEMLKKTYPIFADRIVTIKNYLDPKRIISLANDYKVDTLKYKKEYVFTSVIRLDKEKGADLLVDVAFQLKKKGVSFVWFVVGDGDCRSKVEKLINRNSLSDSVILVGFQDNPYPYISCCDYYIHPAYEESFGLAILEALILDKFVLSTDTMGADEVLAHGEFGVLVPIDSLALANNIIACIDTPVRSTKDYTQYYESERDEYKLKWTTILDGKCL